MMFQNNTIFFILFLTPAIVITIQNYLIIKYFYFDTPIWLHNNQRTHELQILLRKIFKPWAWQQRMNDLEDENFQIELSLQGKKLKNPMTLSYVLCILQQFSGINVVIFYSKIIFQQNSFVNHQGSLFSVIIMCINFVSVLPNLILIGKVGRKNLFLQGLLGLSFSYGVYSIISFFTNPSYKPLLQLFILILVIYFYETSLGTIIWIYITEILEIGWIGSAITIQWISAGTIAGFYPLFYQYNFNTNIDIFFTICGFICFVGFLVVYKITKQYKSVEEVKEKFCREEDSLMLR